MTTRVPFNGPYARVCGCCEFSVPAATWDALYDACDDCSWCQSLGQCLDATGAVTCCHGKCRGIDP